MEISFHLPVLAALFFGSNGDAEKNLVVEHFASIPSFFSEDTGEISIAALGIKRDQDSLTFSDIDLLAAAIVNIVNAEGMFEYASVSEFFRINNCGTKKDAVVSHLHVFKSIKAVYGEDLF